MEAVQISISQINERHEVRDAEKLTAIATSMTQDGWQGRPLLVIQAGDGYQGLTGSHRYAAARAAGLKEVPCVEVDAEAFYAEYEISDLWDDEITLSILEEIGDESAADLMRQEVERN